jgi:hypothetical protein
MDRKSKESRCGPARGRSSESGEDASSQPGAQKTLAHCAVARAGSICYKRLPARTCQACDNVTFDQSMMSSATHPQCAGTGNSVKTRARGGRAPLRGPRRWRNAVRIGLVFGSAAICLPGALRSQSAASPAPTPTPTRAPFGFTRETAGVLTGTTPKPTPIPPQSQPAKPAPPPPPPSAPLPPPPSPPLSPPAANQPAKYGPVTEKAPGPRGRRHRRHHRHTEAEPTPAANPTPTLKSTGTPKTAPKPKAAHRPKPKRSNGPGWFSRTKSWWERHFPTWSHPAPPEHQ